MTLPWPSSLASFIDSLSGFETPSPTLKYRLALNFTPSSRLCFLSLPGFWPLLKTSMHTQSTHLVYVQVEAFSGKEKRKMKALKDALPRVPVNFAWQKAGGQGDVSILRQEMVLDGQVQPSTSSLMVTNRGRGWGTGRCGNGEDSMAQLGHPEDGAVKAGDPLSAL